MLKDGNVDLFDVTVMIRSGGSGIGSCRLADQVLLGNDRNNILVNYGIGEAGAGDKAVFLAGVCSTPLKPARRRLYARFLWLGVGGCQRMWRTTK